MKTLQRLILCAAIAVGIVAPAHAQSNVGNGESTFTTPLGRNPVAGTLNMSLNSQGQAVPANGAPITGIFSGADTTTASATLAGTANKTTYICGFNISGLGATAATTVSPTVGALIGGNTFTFTGAFTFAAGATVGDASLTITFPGCIPANATNTAITVTVPGAAGNTALSINAWGVQL